MTRLPVKRRLIVGVNHFSILLMYFLTFKNEHLGKLQEGSLLTSGSGLNGNLCHIDCSGRGALALRTTIISGKLNLSSL